MLQKGTYLKFTFCFFIAPLLLLSTTPPPAAPALTATTLTTIDQKGPKAARAKAPAVRGMASPLR